MYQLYLDLNKIVQHEMNLNKKKNIKLSKTWMERP